MLLHSGPPSDMVRQQARLVLQTALLNSLSSEQQQWLNSQLTLVGEEKTNRSVDMAFGFCPRRLGHEPLIFSNSQKSELAELMPGWELANLCTDEAARILILTCFEDSAQLSEQLTRLLRHADLNEQLALYKGLPLYPASDTINDRLADGLRSNMSDVFEAIAHDNPYAAWHLDTHRFNHMVLKALFIDSTLAPITGLESRNNAELARMLLDTARERRAADRTVSNELWQFARPYMTAAELKEFDLENDS